MADKKISEFESFPGKQDSKTHYVVSSGDSGGSDTTNYKVSFTDLVSGISGELSGFLGGGEGSPGADGSFNFGPTNPSNNSDVINFNQGEAVRMYIDENGGVNVSEKLIVSDGKETILGGATTVKETLTVADGKETILGGATTVKETLTVADGKETILGGPVTIKGDSTFQQSAIFTTLSSDPNPSTGKLYRKGDDLYFDGKKLLTDGPGGGAGKWLDGTSAGDIYYNGGNVGIGTTNPSVKLDVYGHWKFGQAGQNHTFESYDYGAQLNLENITSGGWARANRIKTSDTSGIIFFGATGTDTTLAKAYWTIADPATSQVGHDVSNGIFLLKNGNVGIGTENPTSALDLHGSLVFDSVNASIGLSNAGGDPSSNDLTLTTNNATNSIVARSAQKFTVQTYYNGSYKNALTVQNNGNIYIGPYASSSTTDNNMSYIKSYSYDWANSTTDSVCSIGMGSPEQGSDDGAITFNTAKNVNSGGAITEAMRIIYNGNVGIGTSTPIAKLEISDSSISNGNVDAIRLVNYDYAQNELNQSVTIRGGVQTAEGGISDLGKIVFGKDADYSTDTKRSGNIQFHTLSANNPQERLRINSNGRIDFTKLPCSNNLAAGSTMSGGALSFGSASSFFGTGLSKDIAISWGHVFDGTANYPVDANDLIFGTANADGSPREIVRFYNTGDTRIGLKSEEMVIDGAYQNYGSYTGGTLEIRDEQDKNASTAHLRIVGGSASATTASHYIDNAGVAKYIISQDIVGGEIYVVSSSNGVKLTSGATSWVSASSDRRSKENISPLENVLDKVLKLSPSRYDYKKEYGNKDQIGFIAQDVKEVLPDFYLPGANEEEMSTVKFSDNATTALLVKAIQEQNALIEDLKSRIEALENQ